MKNWRRPAAWVARRLAIAATVVGTGSTFNRLTESIPNNPDGLLLYHGGGAFLDLLLFKATRYAATRYLRRDVEAIFIASVAANALGWALYMARTPPYFYDNMVLGLNYALAIRLLFGDGNVLSHFHLFNWRGFIRRPVLGYRHHAITEEKR